MFLLLLAASWRSGAQEAAPTNAPSASAISLPGGFQRPARGLAFKAVIQATTGHRVLDLDTNRPAHAELRGKILRAAGLAGERARQQGLAAARPNEAGSQLEAFVRAALREAGLDARVPRNAADRAQTAGYPDIEIGGTAPCYLELKTYSAATANTTQRSFYYSPGENPKVTRDAVHLLLAYELEAVDRDGKRVFVPRHWKLLSLQDLEVDLKFEFNQSNRGLYGGGKLTLDEAPVK